MTYAIIDTLIDVVSKLLIDSAWLSRFLAREPGVVESFYVTWLGKSGSKDWGLRTFTFILEHD
jgi:hypothetical protein